MTLIDIPPAPGARIGRPRPIASSADQADREGTAVGPAAAAPEAFSGAPPRRAGALRAQVVRGTVLTLVGAAVGQAMRFGSNLVLAWLLFPEAFGLMAMISAFLACLEAFSDFGVHASLVQNKREDRAFLNTAYTLQAIRGMALWLGSCLIAWPVTVIMEMANPDDPYVRLLLWMLPVAGLNALVSGFTNTSVAMHVRHLALGRLTVLDLVAQAVSISIMIGLALVTQSPWSLLIGPLAGNLIRVTGSHTLLAAAPNRFQWDAAAVRTILSFGKWIFFSTALFFLVRWSDRLLLGSFIGLATVGVYHIAVQLAEQMNELVSRLTRGVLFPAFSRVAREDPQRMKSVYYRARLRLDALAMPAIGIVLIAGPWLISLLYRPEYFDAGWMLQLLSIKAAMYCMLTPCETCLFSLGHARYGFYRNLARAVWVLGGIPLGWTLGGVAGVIWAVALSEIPVLLVLWWAARRHGLLDLVMELRAPGFLGVGAMLGWALIRIVEALT